MSDNRRRARSESPTTQSQGASQAAPPSQSASQAGAAPMPTVVAEDGFWATFAVPDVAPIQVPDTPQIIGDGDNERVMLLASRPSREKDWVLLSKTTISPGPTGNTVKVEFAQFRLADVRKVIPPGGTFVTAQASVSDFQYRSDMPAFYVNDLKERKAPFLFPLPFDRLCEQLAITNQIPPNVWAWVDDATFSVTRMGNPVLRDGSYSRLVQLTLQDFLHNGVSRKAPSVPTVMWLKGKTISDWPFPIGTTPIKSLRLQSIAVVVGYHGGAVQLTVREWPRFTSYTANV